MTPEENVAIMRRAYEAFNTGDMGTLTELMDETVWHLPGRSPMAGDYKGSRGDLGVLRPARGEDWRDLSG